VSRLMSLLRLSRPSTAGWRLRRERSACHG
jgi:hypothetical protein